MLLETQKAEIGYQSFQDSKEHSPDEKFINENPDCWEIIKLLSASPFVTQREICERFNFSKNELIEKNKKIRESDWAQYYIINSGVAASIGKIL